MQDIFGRIVNTRGITLVDWEGYIANPAIKLFLTPPSNASFPLTTTISASGPRLYFNLPSTVGSSGPTKTVTFASGASIVPFYLSIFPDRDSLDESYALTITGGPNPPTLASIHVVDQDRDRPSAFHVLLDFSKDSTGFFDDPAKRAILQAEADDWAYFIDDMQLDTVPVGQEQTFIWFQSGFVSGYYTTNSDPYVGYLLYPYGFHSSALRSGGEPSFYGGMQSSGGIDLPLKRSGGTEIETQGNYNSLGWYLATGDDDWWVTGNLGNELNDLFSITHHESGHALFFNPAYPRFDTFKNLGMLQDAAVLAYHGSYPAIDASDHFNGSVDNASLRGAFGNEYGGVMPQRRWILTKLDLLCAQAIGYSLRTTSAFVPVAITDSLLAGAVRNVPYADTLRAAGGIPFYDWTVLSGALPPGLALDTFSGAITGIPTSAGSYSFTVKVLDYDSTSSGARAAASMTVLASTGVAGTQSPELVLDAARPNPSGSGTTLRFRLPRATDVDLALYDALGRRVRTLASGRLEMGEHAVQMRTSDLRAGAYFCRLAADGVTRTTSVLVTR